jgi:hypothetical protein
MYSYRFLTFLFISFVAYSCAENKIEVLHKEIMAVHDDIMPKTGEISYLYLSFRKKMETDSSISINQRNELSEQAADLEKAEDEMMTWMNDFISPQKLLATKNEKEILSYLNEQKEVISRIKIHTETSLEKAEKLKKDLSIND